jgi:hypothetical protein
MAAVSGFGLLVELNAQMRSTTPRLVRVWPGLKMSLYSGTLLWILSRWLKRHRQSLNVSLPINLSLIIIIASKQRSIRSFVCFYASYNNNNNNNNNNNYYYYYYYYK